jgi:hypothetical protein
MVGPWALGRRLDLKLDMGGDEPGNNIPNAIDVRGSNAHAYRWAIVGGPISWRRWCHVDQSTA